MNKFMKLFCAFCLIYAGEVQSAECDFWSQTYTNNKFSNGTYYTCFFSTEEEKNNEKVTRIEGKHESGQTDTDVKMIEMYEDYKLKTLSSILCQKFSNLKVIDVAQAEMKLIDDDSLLNCQNLDTLDLGNNKIQELPEYLLIRNTKLTSVRFYGNQLTSLPENFFLNQKELLELKLEINQINFLPDNVFRSLKKLELLNFYGNKLGSINPKLYLTLKNLKDLNLEFNQISEIPSKCFAQLRNLRKLYLNYNIIKTLKSDSFEGLENLQILKLRGNRISELPMNVIAPLKNLVDLSFRSNELTIIHSDSFGIHYKLAVVYIQENKINAIDEKVIDNIDFKNLNLTDNICTQSVSRIKALAKLKLRTCFANYQPREKSTCGRSGMPQGNIIGGEKIKRGAHPWIAALMRPNGQFFCGGTLVTNRKVVTAAHCIHQKWETTALLPREIIVLLGFYDLSNSLEIGRVPHAVKEIKINEEWSPYIKSYDADIAVLTLHSDVTFNEHVQPICMPTNDHRVRAAIEGFVVGNGKGGEANEYENIPKILKMPIQTTQHCAEKDIAFQDLLTGRTFCAGTGTGQGVCTGDSGSGFVVKIGNNFYLRGIVSASLSDSILGCDVNSYSVFTDASKFVNWINRL